MNNQNEKKIFFILNTLGLTGGVKVIFEHANLLAEKGYDVNLIHLLNINNNFIGFLKAIVKKIKYTFPKHKRPSWFKLDKKIKIKRLFDIKNLSLSANDVIIATANETADFVSLLRSECNNRFYFIQDYETWTRNKSLVDRTYQYNNLIQITTTKTLYSLMENMFNKKPYIIECGVNEIFFSNKVVKNNENINILMLFHPLPKKGFQIGLKAIEKLKSKNKNIKLNVFGAYKMKTSDVVDNFYFKPSQEDLKNLYNQADIFLYPALEEGFGITLIEAAASKCAMVSTRVGWVKEYGKNNENVIFIEKNNINDIIEKIELLIKDSNLKNFLGEKASLLAKNFSWEKSNKEFEKIINQ